MGMVELVLIPANNGQMLMLSNDGVRAGVRVKCQSKELEKLESESSARVFTLALDSDPGSVLTPVPSVLVRFVLSARVMI